VTLYATVTNDGNAAADHVVVQFVDVTNSSSPAPIGQPQTIASIPAGGSGVAQITYDTTTSAGLTTNDRRIQVVVDPNNFIAEGRESDNSGQKTITLAAESAPNLSVATASIGFDPAAPRVGDAVTIIVTVLNDGDAPASNVTVQFLDATERPPMPIGQVQTIDLIPVGGSDVAQVVLMPPARVAAAGFRSWSIQATCCQKPNGRTTQPPAR
jgi:subtilase family serine protease